jgi:uncharacterized lipoprotein YmbA
MRAAVQITVLACAMLCALGGCVSGRNPGLYVLSPPAGDAAVRPAAPDAPPLQVGAVRVPEFLDSTDILVRRGAGELVPSATGRWGERLSVGIRDALAADLRSRLPEFTVVETRDRDPRARRLEVNIAAFDAWADGHVVLVARWTLVAERALGDPAAGQATIRVPAATRHGPAGDALIVAAMTSALAELAGRIAQPADNQSSLDAAAPRR